MSQNICKDYAELKQALINEEFRESELLKRHLIQHPVEMTDP